MSEPLPARRRRHGWRSTVLMGLTGMGIGLGGVPVELFVLLDEPADPTPPATASTGPAPGVRIVRTA